MVMYFRQQNEDLCLNLNLNFDIGSISYVHVRSRLITPFLYFVYIYWRYEFVFSIF